ncbi:hypothetical protein QTO34_013856 [Cnephaeus nilssonii]|uniref:Uncharacterized protein n=1 Tax=Cnephaeus nilssonii TaxID=3371016 RepID=A0AA40LVA6_CNENI|nr:hypothetical protein QTO34_013856 [Eptesicus nilssonii]
MKILIQFSTTYLCEKSFSSVTAIKTRYRSQLEINMLSVLHPGVLRGGKRPGDQGKVMPHHTSAAATAGSTSLGQPWLPEPWAALSGWAATNRGLPVPRASLGPLGG